MTRRVLLLQLGAAALPEVVPVVPVLGSWAPAVYVPPVIPGPELTIDSGVVIVNCDYSDFHLLLTANVTEFQFINVGDAGSESDVVTIDIEQTGTFTVETGPACTPISGVPYAASQTVGAVDVLGFKTLDAGDTWRYTVQQPVATGGASLAVAIAPSPASDSVAYVGTPIAPDVQVTATPTGGTGTITYAWTRVGSGGTNFLIDDATIAAPTFSIATGATAYSATQQWRCTVTDGSGTTAQATVDITLERTATGGGSGTVNVTNHSISGSTDYDTDPLSDAAVLVNADGTLGWEKDSLAASAASGTYAGEWLASGSASAVEVMATFSSGTTAPFGDDLDTWLSCSTDRHWKISRVTLGGANTANVLLQFRDSTTHVALDSCTISLRADVN